MKRVVYCQIFVVLCAVVALAVLIAAPVFAAPKPASCLTSGTLKGIETKQTRGDLSVTPGQFQCDLSKANQWHFVITNVVAGNPAGSNCPASVAVVFDGCSVTTAPFLAYTASVTKAGVCHYGTTDGSCKEATLLSATTSIYPNWNSGSGTVCGVGNFNVSHVPCVVDTEVLAEAVADFQPIDCDPNLNQLGQGPTDPSEIPTKGCPVAATESGPEDLTAFLGHQHVQVDDLPLTVEDKGYVPNATGSGYMKFTAYASDVCEGAPSFGPVTVGTTGTALSTPYTITAPGTGEFGFKACIVDTVGNELVCSGCENWPIEEGDGGCTFTQGYWKTHGPVPTGNNSNEWPVTTLTLGTVLYTDSQLLNILNESVGGNGLISLAHQLIAAKLNVANGADPTAIAVAIAAADALIGNRVVPPVGSGYLKPKDTSALTAALDDYNNGITGPGHCGS